MSEYAESIRAERARRRLSQRKLSEAAGLYQPTLIDIERGKVGIDYETYRRIMDAITDGDPGELAVKDVAA
jgi:transcriptional regulator with XRE-family HTH domain